MKKSVAAIMILVISISCAVALVLLSDTSDEPREYSVEYVLNAETDGNPNPASYISGQNMELVPVTSDRYFGGWYLDEELTELCMEITPDMSGNLTLYAKWQDSMEGRELKFRFSESVKDGYYQEYTIYGERTITYRSLDPERGYYLNYKSSIKYDYGSKVYTTNDEFGQWNSSKIFDTAIVRSENVTTPSGEVECNVHVHTDGKYSNTIWVGKRDSVIYLCKETLDSVYPGKTFTYTLESQTVVPTRNSISVTAYSDAGITAEGSGEFRPDTIVELKASTDGGSGFLGWYDSSMRLVSEDPVLKVNTGWNDQ